MGVEGKEAPALGPGPHRTSSRSVRALGFSRYFSRARQAEMRSGLSSILPRADEGEFILGALALASWVSSTHHVQLGCSQRVSTLCPVALTQSCQGSPEWWNLRPPSFSDTFTWHPKGQTWGTQTPRDAQGCQCPFCCTFIHRVVFKEVSGHRVLLKSVLGNRGLSACGTTHEATSRLPS